MIDAVVDAHLYKFDHIMDRSLENGKKDEIIDAE
jgi:hypothetical protein